MTTRKGVCAFWLWLISVICVVPAMAAPLTLSPPVAPTALASYLDYWCDGDGQATLAQARQQDYRRVGSAQVALGYRDDACWFRVSLLHHGDAPLPLWLTVDYALLDALDVYLVQGDDPVPRAHWSLGEAMPFAERPVATRAFTVPLSLPAASAQMLYLRVQTQSSMTVPVQLSGSQLWLEYALGHDWILGVLYGIGFGLFAYHLVLWLGAREKANRFYVLHVGSALLYVACLQGVAQRFWPALLPWPADLPFLAAYLALLSGALFARDFLDTVSLPKTDACLRLLIGALSLAIFGQLLLPHGSMNHLQGLFAILTIATLMPVGLICLRHQRPQARVFLLAWGMFLVMVVALALNTYGLLSTFPVLLNLHGLQIALACQQILLSLGLAGRLNTLKRESLERAHEMARAQADNAAKSEFLARMSHEIRTPMNAVLGLTELMRDTRLDPTQRNYMDTIYNAGQSLLGVINDILDYSKIAAGKLALEAHDFNLPKLLEDCLTIFHGSAEQKGLRLVADLSADLPEWVSGDGPRLRQVVLNLLSNAVKFTQRGEVRLSAHCVLKGDVVWLHCVVADEGIGMTRVQVAQLFESFQQADISTTRRYGGTGLGLAISRQLVELMGGGIEVESRAGQGSRFHFRVRLLQGRPPELGTDEPSPSSFAGVKVLLVEDNAVNQMVVRALLGRLGVSASLASGGEEALEMLAAGDRFDLILMDCEMPGLDGYETTRRIRLLERSGALPHRPVIALTAHALSEHRERCLAAGMDDHLSKPLTLQQVTATLYKWLPPRTGGG
jgi:signal transduction histidine kinase/CheY-like chemotaxis protein